MKVTAIQVTTVVLVLATLAVGAIYLFAFQPTGLVTATEKPLLRIGVLSPLTGDASQWGIPPKEGVELALQQLNTDDFEVELFFEDSQCDSGRGVTAARKLIDVDNVDAIIGAVCSSVTLAVAPIAEENQVVLLSPASTSPKVSEAGDFVFRVVPSDARRGEVFADYLRNDLGYEEIGFVYINNEAGVGNYESFSQRFEELGGSITNVERYEQGATDVRTQLLKLQQQQPPAVVVVSYVADTIILLKQAKELGLQEPLYFQTEAPEDPSVVQTLGDTANGATYILPAEAEGGVVEAFKENFQQSFGKEPALFASEAYDAFNLLVQSAQGCGADVTASCIRDRLYATAGYQGTSGIITFDEKGDVVKPMAIKQIEQGQKRIVATK